MPGDEFKRRFPEEQRSQAEPAERERLLATIPADAKPTARMTVSTDGKWSVHCLVCGWTTDGRAHPTDAMAVSSAAIDRHRTERHPEEPLA
jgi:hypothetical protein